jgi:hypothetical protein
MEEFTASTLRVMFPLTDEVQLKIAEGIRPAAQNHVPLGQHETFIFDPKIKRTGNRPIKKRTMSTYGEQIKQASFNLLCLFCIALMDTIPTSLMSAMNAREVLPRGCERLQEVRLQLSHDKQWRAT